MQRSKLDPNHETTVVKMTLGWYNFILVSTKTSFQKHYKLNTHLVHYVKQFDDKYEQLETEYGVRPSQ